MDYEELVIDFTPLARGAGCIRLSASHYGGHPEPAFEAPFAGDELERLLRSIEAEVRRHRVGARHVDPLRPGSEDHASRLDPEETGSRLFESILGAEGGPFYDRVVAHVEGAVAAGRPTGLRLRLVSSTADDELAAHATLPWELLFAPATREFLARVPGRSLVRHIDVERPLHPVRIAPPLRVLLVESAPTDQVQLDLPEERRRIREALEGHRNIELHPLPRANLQTLRTALRDLRCHVLHFMGHGGFDPAGRGGTLIFEAADGRGAPVPARGLDDHLKGLPDLGLVVLNACTSGELPRRRGLDPFRGVASALTMAGIPATVAMQFPVSDRAAIAFSGAFYDHLARGEPVDAAVTAGRLAILGQDPTTLEWATPVLYCRSPDLRVFVMEQAERPAPKPLPVSVDRLHVGVRSLRGWGPEMEREADEYLDLTRHFDGRFILNEDLWHEAVYPELRAFLLSAAGEGRPLLLELPAHATVAFAAGYVLEGKSGLDIAIRQRTRGGVEDWSARPGSIPQGPFWCAKPDRQRRPAGRDVALAISVRHPTVEDVEAYLSSLETAPSIGRILDATVHPTPGPAGARDGDHALHLAHTLEGIVRSRTVEERRGTLHLFTSAPNALLFFLGQLARPFGKIQLYEHDPDAPEPAAYRPSLHLPIPI